MSDGAVGDGRRGGAAINPDAFRCWRHTSIIPRDNTIGDGGRTANTINPHPKAKTEPVEDGTGSLAIFKGYKV